MLRNKGLATAVLITACGLGFLWRLSTSGERPGPASHVEAAPGDSGGEPAKLTSGAPRGDGDADGSVDRSKLEVGLDAGLDLAAATTEAGAFEADAVYGRILGPDGETVAGAAVLLFAGDHPLERQAAPLAEAATDEGGRYRFHDLDLFLGYRLHIEADGFLPRQCQVSPGHDEETELARSIAIEGRVLDSQTGQPLAGVVVQIDIEHWSADGYQESVASLSDDDGTYRLPWARLEGMQRVRARRPGYGYAQREFQVDARRTAGYDLRLGEGRPVLLEIYDLDTGLVLVDTEFELDRGHRARTDGTGRIDLAQVLPAKASDRRVNLSIGGPEWCRTSIGFTLRDEGGPQLIRVPVTHGGTIRGRVVTAEGAPIQDALIRFGKRRNRFRSRNRVQRRPDLPDNVWIRHRDDPIISAADGSFEIVAVFPGPQALQVRASHPRYADAEQEDTLLTAAGQVVEIELQLGNGSIVQGRITVDGEPASTNVSWNADTGRGWMRSNDHGEYRFRAVTPGEVQLSATLDDKSWSNSQSEPEIVWVEDGQTLTHDIVITSNRAAISGIVRDSAGEPLADAEVIAWASNDEDDFHFSTSTDTNEDGEWELLVEAIPGVMYQLYAHEGPRYQLVDGVAAGSTGIEIVLPELGELRLAVKDALTGEPIEGFSIYWRLSDAESFQRLQQGSSSFSPGPDGSFLAQLSVGTLELYVTAKDLGYPAVRVAGVRVERAASDRPVAVLMERGVTVDVVFTFDPDTLKKLAPLMRRRRLSLVSAEQQALQALGGEYFSREVRHGQALRINDAGIATVRGLARGEYSIRTAPKGIAFEPATFEVPLVDRHRVEVRVVKLEEPAEKRKDNPQ